ncbi:unnamed protein product [Didymodactylos carnosus]|uniref:Chaperonin n=1 Tax=Didymodactylos carnosus TaxID=1234261 RepID=A0A813UI87_9BILA|nr:unnamed protein product [Didymodactylos carnosus]CAF0931084.1 unnamed protein product [Didymodactylos carnosus]CAF3616543.1 unnamed protein product [Didymodactylos carnosus]CAF3707608.1 unnamed protein product [Didymodactylos carnosus]
MSAITTLNPKAESARQAQALAINISAARGLAEMLKTNLGPKGTMKMLVSGAGEIKITKDGNTLLHEMQVQHPTASLIARAATAQDDITGDGTTSIVLLIGELLKQADLYISEGLHPRIVAEGFELAKKESLNVLDKLKIPLKTNPIDREILVQIARTSLRTKLTLENADLLTEIVVDALLTLHEDGKPIDLNMVEIMEMMHRTESDSRLVRGIVMDHGGRHPSMPKALKNAYILTCNVSLEYEKTEVNAGFFYKNAEERDRLVSSERKFIDDRVQKILDLKKKVCGDDKTKHFVVINQKGIDPFSLDALAKEGILALRRAKRRNMERLTLACGGEAMNSLEDLTKDCLGYAEDVYEHVLGEEKFTFVEGCKNPKSVTILLKGSTKYIMNQLKDGVRDGLRSVVNAIEDGCVIPGAGALEIVTHQALTQYKEQVKGRARLGIQAFAEALLIIPKAVAQNAGHDQQDTIVKLQHEYANSKMPVGVDVTSGEPMDPKSAGIYDNYRVKKQLIHSSTSIATNLILVDEILRAGLSSLRPGAQ